MTVKVATSYLLSDPCYTPYFNGKKEEKFLLLVTKVWQKSHLGHKTLICIGKVLNFVNYTNFVTLTCLILKINE